MKTNKVSIKAITADTVTVAGYGVIFGGVDLEGETFSADTDYMLALVPSKPVLYDHGQNKRVQKNFIGDVSLIEPDENGLWVEAELSRHSEYMTAIMDLVEKGALGWSSGSVEQLALREGKSIKRWPVVEFSLTPTPAEPRTLGVEQLKALAEMVPAIEALADGESEEIEPEQPEPEQPEPEQADPEPSQPAAEMPADDIAVPTEDKDEDIESSAEDPAPEAQSAEPTPEPDDDLDAFYQVIGDFIDTISERIGRKL